MNSHAELFLFVRDDVVIYIITTLLGVVDDSRIKVKTTPLLRRFGLEGTRVYFKYSTFILPTKIVGKSDDFVLLDFPALSPEKPLGDRKSIRVKPSPRKPVYVSLNGKEKEVYDISEVGFSVKCSEDEIDTQVREEKTFSVVLKLPVEHTEIRGEAKLVNVRELKNDEVLCGYELYVDDTDMVKIRFYIYERVKQILKGID
ncbi:MAG: hypothetical protein GXO04_01315 [Aquificae bacterium]|nr:hypothetical protein [Aquificota bacterium]